jgi:hypothetical protein
MATHEGLPVAGYLPQPTERVALVNANKRMEEMLLRCLDEMMTNKGFDASWTMTARRHIEIGFMCMNRAIFQPARIALDGDAASATDHQEA